MGDHSEPTDGAVRSWLAATADLSVVAALRSIFADTAAAIAARGPTCWASGRCCNFESAGHRLYVTGLEAAYTVVNAAVTDVATQPHGTGLSLPQLAEARTRGGCPFQRANLCGIHDIKPVACRVYFCDMSAQAWQHDLAERMHERVRALHVHFEIPYLYAEWRGLLELILAG